MARSEARNPHPAQDADRATTQARPTVGLLTYGGSDPTSHALWAGVSDVVQAQGANLIAFAGEALESREGFIVQANILYEMVTPDIVDGLVIFGGMLAHEVGSERVRAFVKRYAPLPMVNVSEVMAEMPHVLVDNYQGMRAVVAHLVEEHPCRRIAFIRGPEGHIEAETRYQAYVDVLTEHGLPVDPALVAPGGFGLDLGARAIEILLDERQVALDAVIGVNDYMAIQAMASLRRRGFDIPGDVAVVGFDDRPESKFLDPPLTTVSQPWYTIGRRAGELLMAQLRAEPTPDEVLVPPELVIRQSCGCLSRQLQDVVVSYETIGADKPGEIAERACVVDEGRLLQAVTSRITGMERDSVRALVAAFTEAVAAARDADERTDDPVQHFLTILETILRRTMSARGDIGAWQHLISTLRRQAVMGCGSAAGIQDVATLARAENLWHQARILIGRWESRVEAQARLQDLQRFTRLQQMGEGMRATETASELMAVLVNDLPTLGIPRCYLSLYEDPTSPTAWSHLLLAYDEQGRRDLGQIDCRFPTPHLMPEGLFPTSYNLIVEPLYFRDNQLGIVLLEADPWQGTTYHVLRGQISSALKGTLLLEEIEERAYQIQAAAEVAQIVSSFLELDVLMEQVVSLVRERFNLYYVGLFLVDESGDWTGEPNRWAVLRAGTGEAGESMMAAGHRLEVGGSSMIGQCVANQEARIALDVGQAAVRFDNPHLPDTHSEMALPLISRGEAIGALTIQSVARAAFSEEDITILQTMASQVAIAIENTRLLDQAQAALAEMEATQRRYLQRAWSEFERRLVQTEHEVARSGAAPVDEDLAAKIQRALAARAPQVVRPGEDEGSPQSVLVAPSLLRGEVVGGVTIHDDSGEREWTEDEIALMEVVAERMAMIAENMRLLDETQRRAARERVVGEVTAKMRETLDMDSVMQAAVSQMREALDIAEVEIRLEPGDVEK